MSNLRLKSSSTLANVKVFNKNMIIRKTKKCYVVTDHPDGSVVSC